LIGKLKNVTRRRTNRFSTKN